MTEHSPLHGVRVIEAASWAGAYAGKLLAEAGADVLRIVPPGGDPLAAEPPFFGDSAVSIQETWYNLGKRAVALDLTSLAGREALVGLLAGADILLEDWAPGAEPLSAREFQAGLVRVSLTHAGCNVPRLHANDLVGNALSGGASVTGDASTAPITGYGNQTYRDTSRSNRAYADGFKAGQEQRRSVASTPAGNADFQSGYRDGYDRQPYRDKNRRNKSYADGFKAGQADRERGVSPSQRPVAGAASGRPRSLVGRNADMVGWRANWEQAHP